MNVVLLGSTVLLCKIGCTMIFCMSNVVLLWIIYKISKRNMRKIAELQGVYLHFLASWYLYSLSEKPQQLIKLTEKQNLYKSYNFLNFSYNFYYFLQIFWLSAPLHCVCKLVSWNIYLSFGSAYFCLLCLFIVLSVFNTWSFLSLTCFCYSYSTP